MATTEGIEQLEMNRMNAQMQKNSAQNKYGKTARLNRSRKCYEQNNKEQLTADHVDWAPTAYPTQHQAQSAPCQWYQRQRHLCYNRCNHHVHRSFLATRVL